VKVILDANVWISYLLAPDETRTVVKVVEACFTASATLFVPPELIDDLKATVRISAHLSSRIPQARLIDLVDTLHAVGIVPPPIAASESESQPATHDAKDDYLLAQALLIHVDYLITGDKDLLILEQIQNLRILSAAQFWAIIAETL
jgi:putative PIN family toxin of toxin-antitoxin system